MTPLSFSRAVDSNDAASQGAVARVKYLGGGTNLVDLMRETVENPTSVVDVSHLSRDISEQNGGLLIGAAVRNTALADHHLVRTRYPMLSRAILAGASAQIRNMATVGGNILQRTRCAYFYDNEGSRCNKRNPGEGCDAVGGFNRMHAILGTSPSCVATHPSDMCVALAALDAVLHIKNVHGDRTLPFNGFHQLPGDRPDIETLLKPGDLITAVSIPALPSGTKATYRKVRDRASYAFALVSVAAALEVESGTIKDVRLALGGVAAKPWRAEQAEAKLRGQPVSRKVFREAAEAELAAATPLQHNAFKIELAIRTITAVLGELSGEAAWA